MVYKTKVSWDATYDVIVIGFGVQRVLLLIIMQKFF